MGLAMEPIIAHCLRFDDARGHEELLCMLNGNTPCFTFYTPPDSYHEISKHKIRFISPTFGAKLAQVRQDDPLVGMAKLCKLIVQEMANCEVIVDVKTGKSHQLMVTEKVRERLKNREVVIKNKEGKEKQYSETDIETKSESFFQSLAKSFASHIEAILRIDSKKMLKELEEEEERRKSERKFSLFGFSFTSFMSHVWTRLFSGTPQEISPIRKASLKPEDVLREQQLSREKTSRRSDEKRQDVLRKERDRDNIKFDDRRIQRNKEEEKASRKRLQTSAPAA